MILRNFSIFVKRHHTHKYLTKPVKYLSSRVTAVTSPLLENKLIKNMPKLFTDEGNPFALRILAACYQNNLKTEILTVKYEG